MTVSLKIELLKVFTVEFNLSSDKELKPKKDKPDEKESAPTGASDKQPSKS